MAINYNSLKSLKGTSIGTIVPWCGDLPVIPKGWIACNGEVKNNADFPLLAELIGTRYGGVLGISFAVPNFANKAPVDYHQSHANISGIGMSNVFKNAINNINDVANAVSASLSSNIDLRVDQTSYNNISAAVTKQQLIEPSFIDAVYIAGRLLGDDHIASHSHPAVFDTTGGPSQWVEACQNSNGSNCFSAFECKDDCNNNSYYATEANNPGQQSLYKGFPQGGTAIYQPGFSSPTVDFAQQNNYGGSGIRNYINSGEDPVSSNNGGYGYNTSLDQNAVNFVSNSHNVHDHVSLSYDITVGSMSIPSTYNINNIGTSNILPQNDALKDIGTITIDVDTPVGQVLYIIRAY